MKIGLIRHFKVKYNYPFNMRGTTIEKEMEKYDNNDLETKPVDLLDLKWNMCFSSDLSRAMRTAQSIYKGDIVISEKLREVEISDRINSSRFPVPFLFFKERVRWLANWGVHPESYGETLNRADEIVKYVISRFGDKNVLIVSHAFFILAMQKILFRNGFEAKKIIYPRNAVLYLFSKK